MKKQAFSTEVNVFRAETGQAVVHLPIVGQAMFVSDVAEGVIHRMASGEGLDDTLQTRRVVEALDSLGILGEPRKLELTTPPLDEFRPTEATLIFTESCNLACGYCYSSATPTRFEPMSEEVAFAAVDLVVANAAATEQNTAMFRYIGGGEPTIEWALLTRVTEYIKSKCAAAHVRHYIRLITNGTLLTSERVSWLAENIQFVTLSFDILPELQALRPYASGKSTHSKLLEVVAELGRRNVQFHLRSTISVAGAGRLAEMVQFVSDHCDAKSIRFEPMSEIGRSLKGQLMRPTQQVFVESYKAAHKLGKKLNIEVSCKMVKNKARRSSRFCEVEFSVTPRGKVSACHRYSRPEHVGYQMFEFGRFEDGTFKFDLERLNAVRAIDVHSFKECKTCIARWNCAGGCLSSRVGEQGISETGPLCDLTRELLKFSIEQELLDHRVV